jgi:hypothetical protein
VLTIKADIENFLSGAVLLLKPRAPSAATEGAGGGYSAWITRPSSAMPATIGHR